MFSQVDFFSYLLNPRIPQKTSGFFLAQEEMDRVEALFLELSGGSQSISVDVTLVEDFEEKLDSLEMSWEIHMENSPSWGENTAQLYMRGLFHKPWNKDP